MDDDQEQPPGPEASRPKSLLPYDLWMEEAMRQVALRALAHAAENGLPGGHHFYVTFRTDHPAVVIPKRVLAQYPHEMTIVLQHQFWDLKVDEEAKAVTVGLSFGGVPSQLSIPFGAIAAFADPEVQYGWQFRPVQPEPAAAPPAPPAPVLVPAPEPAETPADAQVVSLDAFRRRPKD